MMRGFAELAARLTAMGPNIDRELAKVTATAARECMERARELAPIGVGPRREPRLVDSFSFTASGLYGEAKINNPHAAYVEFGTGIRGAQSGGGAEGVSYDENWPGMAAQPYMQPAAQLARVDHPANMLAAVIRGAVAKNRNGGDGDAESV